MKTLVNVAKVIDDRAWTAEQKAAMKTLAQLTIDKTQGTNGQTQYATTDAYWMHNQTTTDRQDLNCLHELCIPR